MGKLRGMRVMRLIFLPLILVSGFIAPMLTLLGSGVLNIERPGGGSDAFHVAGGVLKVERDQVTLLTEYAGSAPPPEPIAHIAVYPEDAQG